jgi:hypothetical protein
MEQPGFSARLSRRVKLADAGLCALWILIISVAAIAQSGRRLPDFGDKKTQPAPSAPEPAPTPPPGNRDKTPLVVTSYLADIITSSSVLTGIVSDGLIERLNEASLYTVTREGEMNRKEASDRAKGMSDGYLVWFQLETGSEPYGGAGANYGSQLYVNFMILKAGTGKILTQGHVYQRATGPVAPGPLPGPTGGTQIEYRLRRAGRETGDRVLQAIGKLAQPGH